MAAIAHRVFPWPPAAERRAVIEEARARREQACRAREHARALQRDIERMVSENHFADAIAAQLRRERGR